MRIRHCPQIGQSESPIEQRMISAVLVLLNAHVAGRRAQRLMLLREEVPKRPLRRVGYDLMRHSDDVRRSVGARLAESPAQARTVNQRVPAICNMGRPVLSRGSSASNSSGATSSSCPPKPDFLRLDFAVWPASGFRLRERPDGRRRSAPEKCGRAGRGMTSAQSTRYASIRSPMTRDTDSSAQMVRMLDAEWPFAVAAEVPGPT
jgi:hypothetical protein